MTGFLDAILPPCANNDYRGGSVVFYGFCFLFAQQIFSATVHFLTPDGGKNSIASIIVFEGNPDPNLIMYMFASIAGAHEMVFVVLCGLVLWRYRNLIPLLLALMLVGMLFGTISSTMHPLTPEYFERTPPAMLVRVPKFLLISGLLIFAVWKTMKTAGAPGIEPSGNPTTLLEIVAPKHAGNVYDGGAVAFYGFCLHSAVMLFRSTVHLLKDDSGVNSIASIMVFEGDPDPNNIIYLFSSIGGGQQMLFVILYGLVLWRYRSLIPLMFAFLIIESCFGFVVAALHPLDPMYFEHVPPGKLGMLPRFAFVIVMFVLAVRNTGKARELDRSS